MKTLCTSIALSLLSTVFANSASAIELWEAHLPGLDTGLSAGSLPPKGFYGVLNVYSATNTKYDNAGNATPIKLDAVVVVPVVLWSTGLTVLGGRYAVAFSQPFDCTKLTIPSGPGAGSNSHWGRFNSVIAPAIISWDIDGETSIKAGLFYLANNASSSPANPPSGRGVGAGNGHASWMPELGVTRRVSDWQLNADFMVSRNLLDGTTGYQSGTLLQSDFSAIYQAGRVGYGLGGFTVTQLTDHSGNLPADCAGSDCRRRRFALGPLVTYQLGPAMLSTQYHRDLVTRNGTGGDIFNFRVVVPF